MLDSGRGTQQQTTFTKRAACLTPGHGTQHQSSYKHPAQTARYPLHILHYELLRKNRGDKTPGLVYSHASLKQRRAFYATYRILLLLKH